MADCITCLERDGIGKPVFDDLIGTDGDCVSCIEYNSATPIWNGTKCVSCAVSTSNEKPVWTGSACTTCPENTTWDTTENSCIANINTGTFEITHSGGNIQLMELLSCEDITSITPQSASEETTEFLSKYGIITASDIYPDCWAGAMKYCQDLLKK